MKTMRAADGAAVFMKAIIFNLALQLVAGIVVLALSASGAIGERGENVLNLVFTLLLQGTFFLAFFLTAKAKKRRLAIGFVKTDVVTVVLAIAAAVICVFCFSHLAQWFDFFLRGVGYKSMGGFEFSSVSEAIIVVLASVVAAPICEEIVFRGALFGGLLKKVKPVPAIFISALCFSFMHMNPEQTVYQFILGCVSAVIAMISGSLIPSIVLHAGNNFIAVLLSLVPSSGEAEALSPSISYFISTVIYTLVGALLIFAIIFGLVVKAQKKFRKETEKECLHSPDYAFSFGKSRLPLLIKLRQEEEEDACNEGDGTVLPPLLGKRSHVILITITLGICMLMWLLTFAMGLIA